MLNLRLVQVVLRRYILTHLPPLNSTNIGNLHDSYHPALPKKGDPYGTVRVIHQGKGDDLSVCKRIHLIHFFG